MTNEYPMKTSFPFPAMLLALAGLWSVAGLSADAAPAGPDLTDAPASAHARPATEDVPVLVARGRSQYLAGDSAAANVTFHQVAAVDAGNADALYFLKRIDGEGQASGLDRANTSAQMIDVPAWSWRRKPRSGLRAARR